MEEERDGGIDTTREGSGGAPQLAHSYTCLPSFSVASHGARKERKPREANKERNAREEEERAQADDAEPLPPLHSPRPRLPASTARLAGGESPCFRPLAMIMVFICKWQNVQTLSAQDKRGAVHQRGIGA